MKPYQRQELTVIIDGSGSMSGNKITTASLVFKKLVTGLYRIYGPTLSFQVFKLYFSPAHILRPQYSGNPIIQCGTRHVTWIIRIFRKQ